jgi:amidase
MVGQNDELQTALEQRGLTVIAIDSKDLEAVPPDREVFSILPPVFKYAIDGFLPAVGAPVGSLAEIIAINEEDMSNRAPYGQGNLEKSRDTALSEEETADRVAERIKTYSDALTALFDEYDVDVMFISDDPNGIPLGQAYAPAGWAAMVVPAGYTPEGQPISFGFVARPYEDGKMLTVAYAVEQITQAYRPPNLEATIQMLDERLGDEK